MSVFTAAELGYLAAATSWSARRKLRDVGHSGRAAIVIDDLESTDPWRHRAVEVRSRAEAIALPTPLSRIHPERIVSWGLEAGRSARPVAG